MRIRQLLVSLTASLGLNRACCQHLDSGLRTVSSSRCSSSYKRAHILGASIVGIRGGSSWRTSNTKSPFTARTPARPATPKQNMVGSRPVSTTTSTTSSSAQDGQDDRAAVKEMVDSFLTRDTRNTFIGTFIYL
jgi:hypothetical protein